MSFVSADIMRLVLPKLVAPEPPPLKYVTVNVVYEFGVSTTDATLYLAKLSLFASS